MLTTAKLLELLKTAPSGYKSPNDELFVKNNKLLLIEYKKLGVISNTDDNSEVEDNEGAKSSNTQSKNTNKEIFCNAPGCTAVFNGIADFQTHFNAVHRYFCAECRRSLPTSHLLDLHVSEQHDSYFAASAERGKAMYRCFLEECKECFLTPKERKDHCVKAHQFPATFRYDQWGRKDNSNKSHKTATKQQKKPNKTTTTAHTMSMEQEENEIQNAVKNLDDSVRKIKAFSFGHHVEKTFHQKTTAKNKKKHEVQTLENLQEMASALDDVME